MSTHMRSDPVQSSPPASKPKKGKKRKGKQKANGDAAGVAASKGLQDLEPRDGSGQATPTDDDPVPNGTTDHNESDGEDEEVDTQHSANEESEPVKEISSLMNGLNVEQPPEAPSAPEGDRFEALVRDRDNLRAEVTELRKSLEEIQLKHKGDLSSVKEQLEETQGEKDHAESQYRNLLGKVNTIKSQLGERLKADAEELSQARMRLEELEEQNSNLSRETEARSNEIKMLVEEAEHRSKELSLLRNRTNLSQQNWVKEKEELAEQVAYARREFEDAKEAMHNWEVIAMEERSEREALGDKVGDLEEQVVNYREAYEKAASERDAQSNTVDGLQKALQEIQSARKKELRELVESSQAQVEEFKKQHQEAEQRATEANNTLETTQKELERALPFEKEVKEKNLLIGKLRHEAVILNDHLTKALRFLKKGKPDDNVDRQIVTNHFLHFLALDRSDPKKFQVLQLIAALLGWTDEQREQAGLARPGASNNSLRAPLSPFHRTPSTPALNAEYFSENPTSATSKESLAELWSNFLEQEAQAGAKNRSGSVPVLQKSGQ